MQAKVKFLVAAGVFALGAVLAVTPYFTMNHFELLLPGVILVAASSPFVYYWLAKIRSGHESAKDKEILRQAEIEAQAPEEDNDDKK